MEIIFEVHEAVMTARLFGELDQHAAAEIRETIDCSLKQYAMRDLVFDFANVTYMDSSGIGLAMGRYNKVKDLAGSIVIVPGSPYVSRVLGLSGLFGLIPKTSSKRSALEYIYEKGGKGNETGKLV